jgi:phosphomannomutase
MSESGLIVGVSGMRGIVGESLTPEVAVRYAASFGTWLQEQIEGRSPTVVIGSDGRLGWDSIYKAAISGLLGSGCRVREVMVAMTPTVGMLCDLVRADAALIITASHNPQEWNGIKILLRKASWGNDVGSDGRGVVEQTVNDACAPDAATAQEIVSRFHEGKIEWWDGGEVCETTIDADTEDPHCLRVLNACEKAMGAEDHYFWDWFEQRLKTTIVIDSVNCSGGLISKIMFSETPCRAIHIYGEGSGIFPHTPEPTRENLSGEGGLCDVVPGVKADVGFAQDPDADRLAVVDEKGVYIGEEYTVVLCAVALMESRLGEPGHRGDKPVFVVNLSTSRMIDDVAVHYGAEVVRTAVGEANVVEAMKKLTSQGRDVVLGGEGNGGVIWAEVTYVRDSLSGMALILSLMARTGKTVSALVSMVNSFGPTAEVRESGYTILKIKSDLAKKADAMPVVEHLNRVYSKRDDCRVDLVDGIRIDWDDLGVWAHVRASNTEAIMRVIVEAPSEDEAKRVAGEIDGHIAQVG